VLALLVALATSPANVASSLNGESTSSPEESKARVERMLEGAQKSVTYDHSGRVVTTNVPISDGEKVAVSLKYDGRNRLQYVVCDDGTRIGLVYDDSGQWQGFSFPDGGKMLFTRNREGVIIGLKRIGKPASHQVPSAKGVGIRRVSFGAPLVVDDCRNAVAAAAAAAASAAAICAAGPSVPCAAAVAGAAIAAKIAYDACTGGDAMAIET
jgi:YD repeat-containing protein